MGAKPIIIINDTDKFTYIIYDDKPKRTIMSWF